jgi:hypothetical protein
LENKDNTPQTHKPDTRDEHKNQLKLF